MNRFGQLRGPLALVVFTLLFGTLGYVVVEGWSFLDALFMTVTTVTTVGYGEVHPLSSVGQIFTIVLILVGVGSVLYTFTELGGWLLATDWGERRRQRQMEQTIARLENHYIVCGFGRVGQSVAKVLTAEGVRFVVVDSSPEAIELARANGYPVVVGNASSDLVLKQSRIAQASGLIAAVATDADNVYVALSARGLRADLTIIARASSEDAVAKLSRAGATHVISPYAIAGQRMGMLAVRPASVELVETLLGSGRESLVLEEFVVEARSRLAGQTVGELRRRFPSGPAFVGLRADGQLISTPANDYVLRLGDTVVVVGSQNQVRAFEQTTIGQS